MGNGSHGMGCMNEVYELGRHSVVDDQPGMKCFETHINCFWDLDIEYSASDMLLTRTGMHICRPCWNTTKPAHGSLMFVQLNTSYLAACYSVSIGSGQNSDKAEEASHM